MSDDSRVLEQLIAQVPDEALRRRLGQEVELLRDSRRFGLVFDRHLPESVRLQGHPIRKGVRVTLRHETSAISWRVLGFADSSRQIALLDGEGGARPVSELTVLRDFGEPIFPGLCLVERIENGSDSDPWHTVINAENYHALQMLRATHRGKVDLIYIDPPYNTGNEGWIYNDRYVDANDRASSSKWLSFMERRLLIARELLKSTGVVIVAIGDDEQHRLRMLLDQVFGASCFLANVVWQGNGKNDAKFTAGGLDYMLMYGQDIDSLVASGQTWRETKPGVELALSLGAAAWEEARGDAVAATKAYRAALRRARSGLEPAVYRYDQIDSEGRVFQATSLASPNPRENLRYEVVHPGTGRPVRTPDNGWRYTRESMAELIGDGRILFGPDEKTSPRLRRPLVDQDTRVPYPTFNQARMPASKRLEQVLGDRRFPFPKDHEVLMRWIRLAAPPDALVVDFFGGSGTTTEAVLRLNAEDGGRRQSILVTNNEVGAKQAKVLRREGHRPGDHAWEVFGVFEHVARPRISTVVTGQRPDGSIYSEKALAANVEFFELRYLDPGSVRRGREFAQLAPLLWLEAGAVGPRVEVVPDHGWALTPTYGVLFSIDSMLPFVEAVTDAVTGGSAPAVVFVVTDSAVEYQTVTERLPVGTETVQLYEDYLANYTINVEGGSRR